MNRSLSRQRSRVRVSSSPPFFSSTCGKYGFPAWEQKGTLRRINSLLPPQQFESASAKSCGQLWFALLSSQASKLACKCRGLFGYWRVVEIGKFCSEKGTA